MLPQLQPIAVKLENERAKLLRVIESANEDQRRALIYEEGWNLYDLVSHLAASEKENVRFLRQLLSENGARHRTLETVKSLDEWNAHAVGKRADKSWDERVAELAEARQITVQTIDAITPDEFAHVGTHAVWGQKSVEGLLKILYLHDIMHRNDIARRLVETDDRRHD